MESISERHHYLPRFFIKGFIEPSAQLWIYDKKNDRISPDCKSPKSVFYEWNKNNIEIDGQRTDILETQVYSFIDDLVAKEFKSIQKLPIDEIERTYFIN